MSAQHGQLVLQGREAVLGGQQFLHGLAITGLVAHRAGSHHAFAIDQQASPKQTVFLGIARRIGAFR